jgi:hypothetical protein
MVVSNFTGEKVAKVTILSIELKTANGKIPALNLKITTNECANAPWLLGKVVDFQGESFGTLSACYFQGMGNSAMADAIIAFSINPRECKVQPDRN